MISGNPAVSLMRPAAFRLFLAKGLACSVSLFDRVLQLFQQELCHLYIEHLNFLTLFLIDSLPPVQPSMAGLKAQGR